MSTPSCVIRNFCSADLGRYARFCRKAESICHSDDSLFLARLTSESGKPVDFSEGNIFLAEERGEIVGACRVVAETAIARAVLRLFVSRGSPSRDIVGLLLDSTLQRAASLKLKIVHADLRESDLIAQGLFAAAGFSPVRRYAEMQIEIKSARIVESRHDALICRPLEPGREAKFTQLQNRAFSDSWGFCPNTTSEIVQLLNTNGYGHDGVIVAYRGEQAVAYCWTAKLRRPNSSCGAVFGRIHMMGVTPEFRGQGMGKYILSSALSYLTSKGIQSVELTADTGNPAAVSLYTKAGFKLKTALVWYEKEIQ